MLPAFAAIQYDACRQSWCGYACNVQKRKKNEVEGELDKVDELMKFIINNGPLRKINGGSHT